MTDKVVLCAGGQERGFRGAAGWVGTVFYVEYLGSGTFAFVDIGTETPLVVRLSGREHPEAGARVSVVADSKAIHRFDANGLAEHS